MQTNADAIDERSPLLPNHVTPPGAEVDEAVSSTVGPPFQPEPEKTTSKKKIISILAVLLIGVLLSNADVSIVLATHALIASEFDDLSNSSWIFVSFGLASTAAQPLVGKLSDLYGRKSVLLITYALFAIGCCIIGVAPSLAVVILGRVLSGIGSAGMSALVSIIITDLVPLRDVASWRSYVNIITTTGRSLGGPVGGWFADTIGWRWTFLVQVPPMVVAFALAWLLVPQHTQAAPAPDPADAPKDCKPSNPLSRLDILGSITLTAAILLLMFPLELGGQKIPWSHPLIFSLLGAAVIASILFILAEKHAAEPVLPLDIFRERDFSITFVIMALQVAAQGSMMFTVPLYFQITDGVSATKAGAHLFPAVLGNTVSQLASGAFIGRTGRYKVLITLGTTCTSVCYMLMLLRWSGNHTNLWESLYVIPGGFGTGMASSAVFIAMTASVATPYVAIASSTMYLSGSIGSLVGLASSAAVLQTIVHRGLQGVVGADFPNRDEFIRRCLEDIGFLQHLTGEIKEKIVDVYVLGFRGAYAMSLGLSVVGTVLGLFVRERTLS
ncbi:multidrug resistance protein [Diplodia corticola]|uniref:Multidrug resistance protein n=1 Tax=Diplodia corticola TaxID=236234 RepID=A0A1J9RWM2_9PEZI|nr:multidrug resistance protein [Diplodia corticola]OJD32236.1 multidrug resistance protein [Diplodia corticola]